MIGLGVITDGRGDYLERAVESAEKRLGPLLQRYMIDDSGDPTYNDWLHATFPGWLIFSQGERRGLAGAVQASWLCARILDFEYVFHLEDDFVFDTDIDLPAMCRVLTQQRHLASFVLKRQPWSPEEIAAGGQIETAPDDYTEQTDGTHRWVEHRTLYSFNPSLVPRRTFGQDWPPILEADVTARLLKQGQTFAYWGKRDDPPLCEHIGVRRSAGYRW